MSKQYYGGQAVIEGVMMRGSRGLSVAVRNPEQEIIIHTEPLNQRIYGGSLARIPFLRGLLLLWDALGLGTKALLFSANVAMEEEEEAVENPASVFDGPVQTGTLLLSLGMAVGLFMLLPAALADFLPRGLFALGLVDIRESALNAVTFSLVTNLIEGLMRLTLVVGYIWAIGLIPDIRRVYGYHGAEHKTINAYEAGADLTPASVARFPLEHPRCGTAFLLTVVITSIIFFSILSAFFPVLLQIGWRILSRIVFLPVISGLAYEFIRFTARHQDRRIIRLIIAPNLALQRLTTREPDERMLEVAIAAFEEVLALEYEPRTQPQNVTVTEVAS